MCRLVSLMVTSMLPKLALLLVVVSEAMLVVVSEAMLVVVVVSEAMLVVVVAISEAIVAEEVVTS